MTLKAIYLMALMFIAYLWARSRPVAAFSYASPRAAQRMRATAYRSNTYQNFVTRLFASNTTTTQTTSDRPTAASSSSDSRSNQRHDKPLTPPWSRDLLTSKRQRTKRNNVVRVRQHVNPLARRFQLPTELPPDWPIGVFDNPAKKLFLDIGVGKGGFLLQYASEYPTKYNYLGLEIRPLAVQFAQERLATVDQYHAARKSLDFVGCNANVDLDRLLALYHAATNNAKLLQMVTIQFPDPHFKASHAKRRVVTGELVQTLASYMPPDAQVFLQSDIQSVLDDMRERFREFSHLFQDAITDATDYYPDNILGIPTEREVSVLKQDLPVYRALFTRTTSTALEDADDNPQE